MATTRKATTTWSGTLLEGSGEVELQSSGIGTFPVTWASRSNETAEGLTSPEELIAAAHASCFSMALSSALAKQGNPVKSMSTTAEVDFVPGTGITEIRLALSGEAEGLDASGFAAAAAVAKENCPVSKALAGVPIKLTIS